MRLYNIFIIIFLGVFLCSCGGEKNAQNSNFTLKISGNSIKFPVNTTVNASISNHKQLDVSSVNYFINDKKITSSSANPLDFEATIPENFLLGNHILKAVVTTADGKKEELGTKLTILSNKKPKIYTYKILNTYPHDIYAYTQGLEFYKDTLYESTGQRGQSSLRKVDYKTGTVIQKVDLDNQYFGEGITILNDTLYMLTWQGNKGFVFDPATLKELKTFDYGKSKEGWGFCNDGKQLFKSDGTEKIWILNPKDLSETYYIQVCDDKRTYIRANELEYINGKIFANSYLNPSMMIINPENGALDGIINFKGLKEKVTQHRAIDVLNGIAYNPKTKTYFVTGKYWDKLFEVELIEKQ